MGRLTAGGENRFEARLEKMRSGRFLRRPVGWVTRGSDLWFGLAAIFLNAVFTVAIARLVAGTAVSERRILIASIAYSIFFAAVFSAIGLGLGDAARAFD